MTVKQPPSDVDRIVEALNGIRAELTEIKGTLVDYRGNGHLYDLGGIKDALWEMIPYLMRE